MDATNSDFPKCKLDAIFFRPLFHFLLVCTANWDSSFCCSTTPQIVIHACIYILWTWKERNDPQTKKFLHQFYHNKIQIVFFHEMQPQSILRLWWKYIRLSNLRRQFTYIWLLIKEMVYMQFIYSLFFPSLS